MKHIILLLISTLFIAQLHAQDKQNITVTTDQEAQYPEGPEELIKKIYNTIKFSDEACMKELNTEAEISFDVMPDSSLSNIQFINKVGYGVDEELLRIFQSLKYQPAIMMGLKIRRNVFQTIPIRTSKMMLNDRSRKPATEPAKPAPTATPANSIQNNNDD